MGIQAAPEVKFRLIQEAVSNDNNMLSISMMCQIAGVSRSGYYQWCSAKPARDNREEVDRKDFDLILEAYRYRGYAKGVRGIHMRLLHMNIIMNVKKIRRLMRKYQLRCPIRGASQESTADGYHLPLLQRGKMLPFDDPGRLHA